MSALKANRRELLTTGALLAAVGAVGLHRTTEAAEPVRRTGIPKLKITAVKTFLLRHKLAKPFGVSVSVPLDTTRDALLVKLETDAGLVGWGETSPINGTRATIDESLGPQLIGRNPVEHRSLWRSMWGANFGNALAVGALDIALNDLRGKALNVQVAELFGGRYSVAREAKIAASVREAVGPETLLIADGNGAYTMESAVRMGHVLHRLDFEAFEEPIPQSPKYAAYDELRRRLPLSLAAGEALDSRATAKELIDRRAMDIIQPDISLCGGIGEALFVAELAALSGIRCIPHCWGGDIIMAATAHLVSLLPEPHWGHPSDPPLLEIDQSENPWRDGLAKGAFPLVDGMISVPTKPGLGIDVDEEVVKRYAV